MALRTVKRLKKEKSGSRKPESANERLLALFIPAEDRKLPRAERRGRTRRRSR